MPDRPGRRSARYGSALQPVLGLLFRAQLSGGEENTARVVGSESEFHHALLGLIAAVEKNCAESSTRVEWFARTYPMPVGEMRPGLCERLPWRPRACCSVSATDREGQIHYLKYDPVFEELRSDPRYVSARKTGGYPAVRTGPDPSHTASKIHFFS